MSYIVLSLKSKFSKLSRTALTSVSFISFDWFLLLIWLFTHLPLQRKAPRCWRAPLREVTAYTRASSPYASQESASRRLSPSLSNECWLLHPFSKAHVIECGGGGGSIICYRFSSVVFKVRKILCCEWYESLYSYLLSSAIFFRKQTLEGYG